MNEITTPAIVPTATEGNLTNLIAERAWFEPERVTMSRPLGDGWQPVTAREVEEEVRATAKGLIAAGIQIGDRRNMSDLVLHALAFVYINTPLFATSKNTYLPDIATYV